MQVHTDSYSTKLFSDNDQVGDLWGSIDWSITPVASITWSSTVPSSFKVRGITCRCWMTRDTSGSIRDLRVRQPSLSYSAGHQVVLTCWLSKPCHIAAWILCMRKGPVLGGWQPTQEYRREMMAGVWSHSRLGHEAHQAEWSYGAFLLHGTAWYGSLLRGFPLGTVPGTWYFFSTTSAEVPSDPYRYQNVTQLCWSPIGRRKSSILHHLTCDTRPIDPLDLN